MEMKDVTTNHDANFPGRNHFLGLHLFVLGLIKNVFNGKFKVLPKIYIYVCVCVCVCVYHTHIHTMYNITRLLRT